MDSHSLNHLLHDIDALHRDCRLDIRHRELFTRKLETFWPVLRDELETAQAARRDAFRWNLMRRIGEIDRAAQDQMVADRSQGSWLDHQMDRIGQWHTERQHPLVLPFLRTLGALLLLAPLEGCRHVTRTVALLLPLLL